MAIWFYIFYADLDNNDNMRTYEMNCRSFSRSVHGYVRTTRSGSSWFPRAPVNELQMTSSEPTRLLIPWNGGLSPRRGANTFMRNCPRPRQDPTSECPGDTTKYSLDSTARPKDLPSFSGIPTKPAIVRRWSQKSSGSRIYCCSVLRPPGAMRVPRRNGASVFPPLMHTWHTMTS
jgi:hypothetical protein